MFVQSLAATGAIALGTILSMVSAAVRANPPMPQIAQNSPQQELLNAHNRYRAEVGVPPLSWSNALARDAQQWADRLASLGGHFPM